MQNYKLCLDCAAEFELERCGGGCPSLKRRKSKSKKRYPNKYRCPLCGGVMIDTTETAELEYARRQQREMPRLLQATRDRGESVAGTLERAY